MGENMTKDELKLRVIEGLEEFKSSSTSKMSREDELAYIMGYFIAIRYDKSIDGGCFKDITDSDLFDLLIEFVSKSFAK